MKIAKSILETVGATPLVKIGRMNNGNAEIFAKVEFFNPGGSVKDRVGIAMVEAAEKSGQLLPGGVIIEPTSGNTGIGLAIAAAVKGYKLILVMPETMSVERRKLAAAYGAEIVLTPGDAGMAICFVLFFGVNSMCSLYVGIFSGLAVKQRWYLPFLNSAIFLLGTWTVFDWGSPDFYGYAIAYLAIALVAVLTTIIVVRNIRKNM
jgi:hypothetical protein